MFVCVCAYVCVCVKRITKIKRPLETDYVGKRMTPRQTKSSPT